MCTYPVGVSFHLSPCLLILIVLIVISEGGGADKSVILVGPAAATAQVSVDSDCTTKAENAKAGAAVNLQTSVKQSDAASKREAQKVPPETCIAFIYFLCCGSLLGLAPCLGEQRFS
mmetsp:Transcript_19711/g.29025  ORF Transcript_19711/g.29025 Transcript_19711/m.29025 type:complete len:117 (-) Transcript_19711:42-392(-)